MTRIFDRAEEVVAIMLLAGVVLSVLAGAIGRAIGRPFPSGPEVAQLLLIWTCMLGADLLIKRGAHIRISALPDAIPDGPRRVLSLICVCFMLGFLGYCGWLGWNLAVSNWAREMGASGLSYGWVTLAMPVGCALMIVSLVRRTLSHGLMFAIEPENRDQEQLL